MSGVIMEDGQQWEHCNQCGKWIKIENLGYVKPTKRYPNGLDICVSCVTDGLRGKLFRFSDVQPAPMWKRALVAR